MGLSMCKYKACWDRQMAERTQSSGRNGMNESDDKLSAQSRRAGSRPPVSVKNESSM